MAHLIAKRLDLNKLNMNEEWSLGGVYFGILKGETSICTQNSIQLSKKRVEAVSWHFKNSYMCYIFS